ncbi:uncharacterized protein BDZ99DRAFT_470876 [Mytilinidion resinicola]|uniref:Uncharacterized protein n=1 Tax=Mytilinidion resinicola TaxID=574789 RepID=A0A6A6ZA82_9PEZI|nr:uncharacterized protein BDZ99DRAFT_470876 [Mytilinidion resinicola]KAF2817940.1 hypothetical protein BDZ99DRAFT_470876 [Mytilinidion resinicola]
MIVVGYNHAHPDEAWDLPAVRARFRRSALDTGRRQGRLHVENILEVKYMVNILVNKWSEDGFGLRDAEIPSVYVSTPVPIPTWHVVVADASARRIPPAQVRRDDQANKEETSNRADHYDLTTLAISIQKPSAGPMMRFERTLFSGSRFMVMLQFDRPTDFDPNLLQSSRPSPFLILIPLPEIWNWKLV